MPELPEVETARIRLEKVLKGHRIVKVVVDEEDFICFDEAEPLQVARALKGGTVTGTGRKGKYFWWKLDRKPWLIFHLGMTGNIEIRKPVKKGKSELQEGWGGLTLYSGGPKVSEPGKMPRFGRLFLTLDNQMEVAITDPRRFGRIRLSEDPETNPAIARLGDDPLQKFPSAKMLYGKLHRRRVAIKIVLLDQSVFAGVGNWIADEVLYQAEISPHILAADLSLEEISMLRKRLLSIVKTAVRLEANYSRYPKNWLFQYRWGKQKKARDYLGRAIMHETIGGRTAAWVPDVQYKSPRG